MSASCILLKSFNMNNARGTTVESEFLPNMKFDKINTHKINMGIVHKKSSNLRTYYKIFKLRLSFICY